jgi:hypothetical protein
MGKKRTISHKKTLNISKQAEPSPMKIIVEAVAQQVLHSLLDEKLKHGYLQRLYSIDYDTLNQAYLSAEGKLTHVDMKYLICFLISMEVKDICMVFNVILASVHSAHYRIRNKFRDRNLLRVLL